MSGHEPACAATTSRVAVVYGPRREPARGREANLTRALDLLRDEIQGRIADKGSETLFVKVNAIDSNFPLACTHPSALHAVLRWLAPRFSRIVVGDNTFVFTKLADRHCYLDLVTRFPGLRFSALTEFPVRYVEFFAPDGSTTRAPYSTLPEQAFTVSLSLPKTHDAVSFTGCSKNMFGCTLHSRLAMHAIRPLERLSIPRFVRSNPFIHSNLARVLGAVRADLAVMDAFEGMEGAGPIFGTAVPLDAALVGTDPLAVDAIGCRLSGLPTPEYLVLAAAAGVGRIDGSRIDLVKNGFDTIEEIAQVLRPHYLQPYQLMRGRLRGWPPRLDFRLAFAYARRLHRLLDKTRESWDGRRKGSQHVFVDASSKR